MTELWDASSCDLHDRSDLKCLQPDMTLGRSELKGVFCGCYIGLHQRGTMLDTEKGTRRASSFDQITRWHIVMICWHATPAYDTRQEVQGMYFSPQKSIDFTSSLLCRGEPSRNKRCDHHLPYSRATTWDSGLFSCCGSSGQMDGL
jgi:hypothetical protein